MYDHPDPASLGRRDVIAAWLVCLALAVPGFVYSEVAASTGDSVVKVGAGVAHGSATPETAICAAGGLTSAPTGG
jgi:hypothetical protein